MFVFFAVFTHQSNLNYRKGSSPGTPRYESWYKKLVYGQTDGDNRMIPRLWFRVNTRVYDGRTDRQTDTLPQLPNYRLKLVHNVLSNSKCKNYFFFTHRVLQGHNTKLTSKCYLSDTTGHYSKFIILFLCN